MSNSVFPQPSPPNGAWAWPIQKRAVFSTIIVTPAAQVGELRIPLMVYPRWDYTIQFNYIKGSLAGVGTALANLKGFYISMQGPANDWLYLDPRDNSVAVTTGVMFSLATPGNQAFGDGTTTTFQMGRLIGAGADIIQDFNGTPSIFVNGSLISGANWSINAQGQITFAAGHVPAAAATLTWSGNFYRRCRFQADQWDGMNEYLDQIWEIKDLRFISVIY